MVSATLLAAACGPASPSVTPADSPVASATPAQTAAAASPSAAEATTTALTTAPTTAPTTPPPAPSPTAVRLNFPVPGPDEIYEFGPDVSASDRAAIQRWTAYGVRLQEIMFGRKITTVTIIASGDPRLIAEKDCESRPPGMPNCVSQQTAIYADAVMGGCFPAPDVVRCFVMASLKVAGPDEPWWKALLYAHEIHHVLFGQVYPDAWRGTMVPRDQVWATGPVWLLEGAATWVGARAAIDQSLTTYAARRAEWEDSARRIDRPLSQLETLAQEERAGFSYYYYALALDELLERAPEGPLSLLAYYEALARGAAWKTAFEQAFGMTVADFYAEFERIRP